MDASGSPHLNREEFFCLQPLSFTVYPAITGQGIPWPNEAPPSRLYHVSHHYRSRDSYAQRGYSQPGFTVYPAITSQWIPMPCDFS